MAKLLLIFILFNLIQGCSDQSALESGTVYRTEDDKSKLKIISDTELELDGSIGEWELQEDGSIRSTFTIQGSRIAIYFNKVENGLRVQDKSITYLDPESYKKATALSKLQKASREGNLKAAKEILPWVDDINAIGDYRNCTALDLSVANGHSELVLFLLDSGALVNVSRCKETFTLDLAVKSKDYDTVQAVLEAGVEVNNWALFSAVDSNNWQIAKLLLDNGADVKATKKLLGGEKSMLFIAVHDGNLPMIEVLLEAGADPNRKTISSSLFGMIRYHDSPLQVAKRKMEKEPHKYQPVVKALEKAASIINTEKFQAENISSAFKKLYFTGFDPLFIQEPSFTFSSFGQLPLGLPPNKLRVGIKLKEHINNCLPDSPSRDYSYSGEEDFGELSVLIPKDKVSVDASFKLTFSENRLASIYASGDPRFKTSEGLSVGNSLDDVRRLYKDKPDIKYFEKLNTPFGFVYIQNQSQSNQSILEISLIKDYVTAIKIYVPGAKIQGHSCDDFYTLKNWNEIK